MCTFGNPGQGIASREVRQKSGSMKRIHYSGGSVLTGDRIAHSIALYAASLARAGSAEALVIPILTHGQPGTAEIVIGPASQLMVEDAGPEFDGEIDEDDCVVLLEERRGRLDTPPGVQPSAPDDVMSSSDAMSSSLDGF